jgi:hypothetical protein
MLVMCCSMAGKSMHMMHVHVLVLPAARGHMKSLEVSRLDGGVGEAASGASMRTLGTERRSHLVRWRALGSSCA